MPRFDVTQPLAETIKTIRIQNKISSKDLAKKIGKSPSYLSKLEKAEIKSIDANDLEQLLNHIYIDNKNFQARLESIFDVLTLRYSKSEIKNQLWFENYDTAFRQIPIPPSLIDELNLIKTRIQITIDELCLHINNNEDVKKKIKNIDSYPVNEWQAQVVDKAIISTFIVMKLEKDTVSKILNKQIQKTNYITILAIAYHLLKQEKFPNDYNLSDITISKILLEARDILNKHKFHSISDKKRLNAIARNDKEKTELLTEHEKENIGLLEFINKEFKVFSEVDIVKANDCLIEFKKNLEWDNMFMVSLMRLRFYELENFTRPEKEVLFKNIASIIKESLEAHKTSATTGLYE